MNETKDYPWVCTVCQTSVFESHNCGHGAVPMFEPPNITYPPVNSPKRRWWRRKKVLGLAAVHAGLRDEIRESMSSSCAVEMYVVNDQTVRVLTIKGVSQVVSILDHQPWVDPDWYHSSKGKVLYYLPEHAKYLDFADLHELTIDLRPLSSVIRSEIVAS